MLNASIFAHIWFFWEFVHFKIVGDLQTTVRTVTCESILKLYNQSWRLFALLVSFSDYFACSSVEFDIWINSEGLKVETNSSINPTMLVLIWSVTIFSTGVIHDVAILKNIKEQLNLYSVAKDMELQALNHVAFW